MLLYRIYIWPPELGVLGSMYVRVQFQLASFRAETWITLIGISRKLWPFIICANVILSWNWLVMNLLFSWAEFCCHIVCVLWLRDHRLFYFVLVRAYGIYAEQLFSITKEDIGIQQQLYEIVKGKNFAFNCLSWKFTEMIMITNEVIPENLVVVR